MEKLTSISWKSFFSLVLIPSVAEVLFIFAYLLKQIFKINKKSDRMSAKSNRNNSRDAHSPGSNDRANSASVE